MNKYFKKLQLSCPEFSGLSEKDFEKKVDKFDDGSFLKSERSSVEALLDSIYVVNPETGYPEGDISIYLSDACNPQIRDFIRQYLLVVNNPVGAVPAEYADVLSEMRRLDGESIVEYGARIGANAQKWYEASVELSKD